MAYELDWAASKAEMSPPLGRRSARSFMGTPSPARLYDLINACSADRRASQGLPSAVVMPNEVSHRRAAQPSQASPLCV